MYMKSRRDKKEKLKNIPVTLLFSRRFSIGIVILMIREKQDPGEMG